MSLDYIFRKEADDLLRSTGDKVFLLLDSGQNPDLMRTLYTLESAPEFRTLLPMETYEETAFKGPLLVQIGNPSASKLLGFFFGRANQGILIMSPKGLDDLTGYCRKLFLQKMDGKSLFLRFYDQRVLLPLYLDMTQSNVKNFFGGYIGGIMAVETSENSRDGHPNIACYLSEPDWNAGNAPLAPFVLTAQNLKAMQATHHNRESLVLHEVMMKVPAYAVLNDERRQEFIKSARREASMYGMGDLNVMKLFAPLWFITSTDIQASTEAVRFLSSPENSVSLKINLLTDTKLFTSNPYPCPVNPVRLMAMNKLYEMMPQWVLEDGNRRVLDPSRTADNIAVRRFLMLYLKYEKDADKLVKTLNGAVARKLFTRQQLQSDFHLKKNLALEAKIVAYLEKEMNR